MNTNMGLLGRKVGMTQLFDEDGTVIAVTVVEAGPNTVVQIKRTDTRDGYDALQLGFGKAKVRRLSKALQGHFSKSGAEPAKFVREVRIQKDQIGNYAEGQSVGVADVFESGQFVDVTGTSKGRGFAGVMKRHNFAGFIRSHGTHEFFRHGGSIGTRLTPGMVLKGKKMPGRMGGARVTVQNLQVVRVDAERNLLFVRGGVPGPNGGYVTVRKAVKR